jgi:hypothetical protein
VGFENSWSPEDALRSYKYGTSCENGLKVENLNMLVLTF